MPIIKGQESTPLLQRAIVLDMGDLGQQAEQLKASAIREAAVIVSDAEQKAEELAVRIADEAQRSGHAAGLEQGLAEGRKQGHEEAMASGAAQLEQLQRSWIDAAAQWEQRHQQMQRQGCQDVLSLALRLAELVVHRIVQIDRSVVVDQLAEALSHVLRTMQITVKIHGDDRQVLEQAMPQLLEEFSHLESVSLVDDDEVGRGGCVVCYGQGQVDATIDTQLRRLLQLILPDPRQPVADESVELADEPGPAEENTKDDSASDDDSV